MKKILFVSLLSLLTGVTHSQDFAIKKVKVRKDTRSEQLIFSISVKGIAGDSVPEPKGQLDGAPVLGYVFPTTLSPTAVGFDQTSGILALALTSHPDFDDTPLWDENRDAVYNNDGLIWHPHWVVLEENKAVPGGLAVKATTKASTLPPTNPGMPMYMDSPGYPVVSGGQEIRCIVPLYRIRGATDFRFDGVTALMYVNTSDPTKPMLGVYQVFSIASGDLSLPFQVK